MLGFVIAIAIICGSVIYCLDAENKHQQKMMSIKCNSDIEEEYHSEYLTLEKRVENYQTFVSKKLAEMDSLYKSQFAEFKDNSVQFRKWSGEVSNEIHELHEYKKKVDALVAKAGFGL